jgi:hypothetical protein
MRWVVGFLVLANLALLMWGLWYHKPLVAIETPSPRPAVAPDKMKLLSEPGVRLAVRTRSPSTARTEEAAVTSSCYQLGSFPTLERARTAGAKLEAWGLAYERVAELETLGPAYRVVLPPLPSKEAAERKRRELAALGFTDNALIQQEEGMENAISFGLFSVEQNARVRVQQLAQKGVRAIIQPVPNVHPIYWLRLAGASIDGQLAGVPLERFGTEDWGSPNIALGSTACHTDATPGR